MAGVSRLDKVPLNNRLPNLDIVLKWFRMPYIHFQVEAEFVCNMGLD